MFTFVGASRGHLCDSTVLVIILTWRYRPNEASGRATRLLFEEEHVRAAAASAAVASPARREVELARSYGADAREIDVRVDGAEYGAQRYEHYENYGPDEHCRT